MKQLTFPIKAYKLVKNIVDKNLIHLEVFQIEIFREISFDDDLYFKLVGISDSSRIFVYKYTKNIFMLPVFEVSGKFYKPCVYEGLYLSNGKDLYYDLLSVASGIQAEVQRARAELSARIKDIRDSQSQLITQLGKLSENLNSLESLSSVEQIKIPSAEELYQEECKLM